MTVPPSSPDDGIDRPGAEPWDPADRHPNPYVQYGPYGPYYGQYGYGGYGQPVAPPQPPKRKKWPLAVGLGAVAAVAIAGVAFATGRSQLVNGEALSQITGGTSSDSSSSGSSSSGSGSSGSSNSSGSSSGNAGSLPTLPGSTGNGTFPFPNSGNSSSGSSTTTQAKASSTQQVGVVDIVSIEKYNSAEAAGTGIVLTSDGEILTNNHVIDGATSIRVTVVSTGKTYSATVVGTSPTSDIAVLKLSDASGLKTANLGDSTSVSVGDTVTGVGNAGGTGGTPSAASGRITALGRTITASDEGGSNSETLHGVIVTNAAIKAGDSGGPLYNAKNQVIGIDTAASTSGTSVGFAIPIKKALAVAAQIRSGVETSSIHIGYPGFLGVSIEGSTGSGALVGGVLQGGAAAKAGIAAGDLITKVGSTTIRTSTQLQKVISAKSPGSKVSVTYTDQTGSHTVTVTLATGPAD